MSDTLCTGMGAQVVNDTVLLLDQVHPTDPPAQPGAHTRE